MPRRPDWSVPAGRALSSSTSSSSTCSVLGLPCFFFERVTSRGIASSTLSATGASFTAAFSAGESATRTSSSCIGEAAGTAAGPDAAAGPSSRFSPNCATSSSACCSRGPEPWIPMASLQAFRAAGTGWEASTPSCSHAARTLSANVGADEAGCDTAAGSGAAVSSTPALRLSIFLPMVGATGASGSSAPASVAAASIASSASSAA
mmetsp:Transcript_15721/g.47705  ORF Transcript_15721/g.47705 Transcript_15721/m.47705 type:complete len:206 (-) Transcript_15721:172-789(-)